MKLFKERKAEKGKRLLRASFGYFLAGLLIPTVWNYFATPFGIFAGFIAALIAIAPVWYLVHYKGIVQLQIGDIAVDMGGGIATAVFVRDSINNGFSGSFQALPTLLFLIIGACLGGFFAMKVEHYLDRKFTKK